MDVVNAQINRRPSRTKANYSPNKSFYCKNYDKYFVYNVLGHDLVKKTQTEVALEATLTKAKNVV
jgi:hypothetical protein